MMKNELKVHIVLDENNKIQGISPHSSTTAIAQAMPPNVFIWAEMEDRGWKCITYLIKDGDSKPSMDRHNGNKL